MKNSPAKTYQWQPFKDEVAHFLVVAEVKNISRSAEILGTSQSQLSKAMAVLESSLGKPLLIRKSRGVELTTFGQTFYKKIKSTHSAWTQQDSLESSLLRLQVGFHPAIGMKAYPLVIHPLQNIHPEISIHVMLGTSLEITRQVADLSLDMGFVVSPQKNPDIVAKKLDSDAIALWTKTTIEKARYLYYHPDMLNIQRILRKYPSMKIIAIQDYEIIAETVRSQKNACGILPTSVAKRFNLEIVNGTHLFTSEVFVITHKDRLKSPDMKALFEKVQNLYKQGS